MKLTAAKAREKSEKAEIEREKEFEKERMRGIAEKRRKNRRMKDILREIKREIYFGSTEAEFPHLHTGGGLSKYQKEKLEELGYKIVKVPIEEHKWAYLESIYDYIDIVSWHN